MLVDIDLFCLTILSHVTTLNQSDYFNLDISKILTVNFYVLGTCWYLIFVFL